jgi:transposase, IS5 family
VLTQIQPCIADVGYRGHDVPPEHKFKVYTTGQKRPVRPQIKHEFKRRAEIEPVIGHLKEHHRM